MPGTRVTATDVDSGETESLVIEDNHVVITDGTAYLSGVQFYPGTGTSVLTIKHRKAAS